MPFVENDQVILTRDRRLLHHRIITRGYWIRSMIAEEQLREVIRRFLLRESLCSFRRCSACNGFMEPVEKAVIIEQLEPKTARYYDTFYRCVACGKLYWPGSHMSRLEHIVRRYTG